MNRPDQIADSATGMTLARPILRLVGLLSMAAAMLASTLVLSSPASASPHVAAAASFASSSGTTTSASLAAFAPTKPRDYNKASTRTRTQYVNDYIRICSMYRVTEHYSYKWIHQYNGGYWQRYMKSTTWHERIDVWNCA